MTLCSNIPVMEFAFGIILRRFSIFLLSAGNNIVIVWTMYDILFVWLSLFFSICLHIYLSLYLSVSQCVSFCMSVFPSFCLPLCWRVCFYLPAYLSPAWQYYLSLCLFTRMSSCQSMHLSACLCGCLCVCLPLWSKCPSEYLNRSHRKIAYFRCHA